MITKKKAILFFHVILFFFNSVYSQNKVVGYYPDWIKYTLPLNQIKFENLTHIVHAFAWPSSTGEISMYEGMPNTNLISAVHNAGRKILIAIGGAGQSTGFASISADSIKRSIFIDNTFNLVSANGFDGVDLDWDFAADINEGKNQTILFKELRKRFDQIDTSLLITMAVSAGSYFGQYCEYEKLSPFVNWFSMMGYDFHGSWTAHAAHNAPLYQPSNCTDGADDNGIRYLTSTRKIPKEKLLLGVPFYGKEFNSAGLYQTRTGSVTDLLYSEIASRRSNGNWEYFWDDFSKVPYLLDTAHSKFVTFDDTTSIRLKCEYALNNNLSGIMIWALGQDLTGSSQPLLETIGKSLDLVTSINSVQEIIVTDFYLFNNYPNPFNSSTVIKFGIPEAGLVTLTVYDLLGREVEKLADKNMAAGIYSIDFNASNLSGGVYFYTLKAGEFFQTKKMIYLK
ncbi:MAG TPA: glycosyl hydrolase family 18 protein [Ignavibacteriaceae bacterium]|nr:glycosyl hydrolase family 18 protein [Ignavibacteriaceae bacterium]